ncbi:MAG: O-methyltransferase [Lachnospiraceae bacterium]|nr:O-methyltransferase [Lachnospiraceae bacterium]
MDDIRLASFLASFLKPETGILQNIRQEALQDGVPVIRPETAALLSFFVNLLSPARVLEVGFAVGYSAVRMASGMPPGGTLHTVENDPSRIAKARENIRKAGMEGRITLYEGDAGAVLRALEGPYDLIFMDAAKAQYLTWLPDVLRLLAPAGVLISDNVLQDGDILESRYAVERRNRTIHARMRAYLRALTAREDLSTVILPVGDGAAVTAFARKGPDGPADPDPDGSKAPEDVSARTDSPDTEDTDEET